MRVCAGVVCSASALLDFDVGKYLSDTIRDEVQSFRNIYLPGDGTPTNRPTHVRHVRAETIDLSNRLSELTKSIEQNDKLNTNYLSVCCCC